LAENRRGDDAIRVVELKLEGISPISSTTARFTGIPPLSEPPWLFEGEKTSSKISPHQKRNNLLKKVSPVAPLPLDHLLDGLTKGGRRRPPGATKKH
jgi:hypothetical protein